jgi:orotidine-5'-phosphate decarboxylase
MRHFNELLQAQWSRGKFLCVGLDPDLEKIPVSQRKSGTEETLTSFDRSIVDAVAEHVCAFKLNSAFYEVHGDEGWRAMRSTIAYIEECAPEVPVILDAKRADIGNTSEAYARAAFDHLRADAITVNPYLGSDGLKPFFDRSEKGVFVLCHTSNKSAAEIQDLEVGGESLYKIVAKNVQQWNTNGNAGIVMGATYPEQLREVRAVVGNIPMLIPGIGTQAGDLEKVVEYAKDNKGQGFIVSVSRDIIYAQNPKSRAMHFDAMIRAAIKER